jgi:hypothetical protein
MLMLHALSGEAENTIIMNQNLVLKLIEHYHTHNESGTDSIDRSKSIYSMVTAMNPLPTLGAVMIVW